jgi:subtilisin-like proprotein convertase family protein
VANVGSGPTSNLVATLQPGGGVTNPSAAQNYGALAAGGASASRPFTFTVDPTTICGNQITLTLQLQDAAANLGTVTFTLDSGILGAASANVYAGAAVTIPDNDVAGVNIAVPISGLSGRIGDLDFKIGGTASSADPLSTTVGLNHSFIGDLRLRLTSPQGTTVTIMTNAGGSSTCSANNIFDMTLNDEAASVLTCPTGGTNGGPLTGSFRPSNALSAFDGQDPNGTWTLNVADLATDDLGSMRAFSLIIATKQCTTCEAAPFVTVGGRVTTPGGAGLRNAVVSIVDPTDGSVRSALTSSFGFYSFGDVANGRTYTLRAASKRYRFANRSLQVNSNLANVDFSGIE